MKIVHSLKKIQKPEPLPSSITYIPTNCQTLPPMIISYHSANQKALTIGIHPMMGAYFGFDYDESKKMCK
ncbi:hypothetical protein [Defluviitalea raffinosedens]|uniref:hypothetical protein n=1 Tax=Defluviitalea raffinosedens TaxID=1450156 RepID=UPI00131BB5E2|nr:hypothetical protein [Defluviitalea raffinosedens]